MDDVQDKVRLMTVHAAKGLEFRHVFLCSMSEGVLPSRKTSTPQGMEEERRLAFVAMTRARDGLYLTEAEGAHEGALRYPRASCSTSTRQRSSSRTSPPTPRWPMRAPPTR